MANGKVEVATNLYSFYTKIFILNRILHQNICVGQNKQTLNICLGKLKLKG